MESERTKQRASVGVVLKRYRCTQASCSDMEQAHGDLCTRSEALAKELSDARLALRRTRERRQKQQQPPVERKKAPSAASDSPPTRVEQQEMSCSGRTRAEQIPKVGTPSTGRAAAATCSSVGHTSTRYVPTVLELQQRLDAEGHQDLQGFYLQVFPLLKGANLEVFRRSRQRFETRQVLLTSDLQRLELWPPVIAGDASPGSSADAASSSRSRPRVAEAFLRVDGLTRIHVPKATLTAVQRAILSATGAWEGLASASGDARSRDGAQVDAASSDNMSPEVATAIQTWSQDAGVSHPPAGGSADESKGGRVAGASSSGTGLGSGRQVFPFDLIMSCSDTWRFMATDVQTFHLTTQAIGALLASQASLPAYAIALGLGSGSHHLQE